MNSKSKSQDFGSVNFTLSISYFIWFHWPKHAWIVKNEKVYIGKYQFLWVTFKILVTTIALTLAVLYGIGAFSILVLPTKRL